MTRSLVAVLLLALLPLTGRAQLGPPPNPTATRQAPPPTRPAPVRPAPVDSLAGQMAPVKSNSQVQEQLRTHPIQADGVAPVQPIQGPAPQPKVYDRHGRIIPGAKPAGPNRVFDSRTGRYYDAIPSGQGQQVKP